jgi:hypothetical protein
MKVFLTVAGLVMLATALRSVRAAPVRKLGALVLLAASFLALYLPTRSALAGMGGVAAWALLPWVELLTRIRRLRLPAENRLAPRRSPDPSLFPNAEESGAGMEEAGFEHVSDCGWDWAGVRQFIRLHWNPEERAVAAVYLCEQGDVAFAFVVITSEDESGTVWRTTNYPFSPTLLHPPGSRWNHVSCCRKCFHRILADHRSFLARNGVTTASLRVPDPDELERGIERDTRTQMEHNLRLGIIRLDGEGRLRYSKRGLVFLWGQFLKDMVRLC